jgi:hypothetical protein
MLTRLLVRRFKLFEEIDIELGQRVLFVGRITRARHPRCKRWRYGSKA